MMNPPKMLLFHLNAFLDKIWTFGIVCTCKVFSIPNGAFPSVHGEFRFFNWVSGDDG